MAVLPALEYRLNHPSPRLNLQEVVAVPQALGYHRHHLHCRPLRRRLPRRHHRRQSRVPRLLQKKKKSKLDSSQAVARAYHRHLKIAA